MASALALVTACVSAPVTIEYGTVENAKTMGFGGGAKAVLRKVSIDPEFYGRGCTSVEVSADGGVTILVQSDASSDWGGFRSAYAVAPEIVEAAVSVVSGPFDILKGALGLEQRSMPQPSQVGGCHGVLED